jgi:hypothetical protein
MAVPEKAFVVFLAESAHFAIGFGAKQPTANAHGGQQSSSDDHAVMFHSEFSVEVESTS